MAGHLDRALPLRGAWRSRVFGAPVLFGRTTLQGTLSMNPRAELILINPRSQMRAIHQTGSLLLTFRAAFLKSFGLSINSVWRERTCPLCVSNCDGQFCCAVDGPDFSLLERSGKNISLAHGKSLFRQGDSAGSVYILTDGVVRLSKSFASGRRQIRSFLVAGDILGLSDAKSYRHSAETITPVKACQFPKETIVELASKNVSLAQRMIFLLHQEFRDVEDILTMVGQINAEIRLASFLHYWSVRSPNHFRSSGRLILPMSRRDIADFLCLSPETISRAINKLIRDQMISIVPGGVKLSDRNSLLRLAASA